MACRNNAAAKAKKRERLFREQDGACYWCDAPMELKPFVHGKTPDENTATLQHIVTKLMPERGQVHGDRRIVLMHHRCCMEYGHAVEQMVGRDVLHARSHPVP